MELTAQPRPDLAAQVLPAPLLRALEHVFAQRPGDVMLVGGTALAGYYAGHRRSDDLDLFARTAHDHRATVLAARTLTDIGARLDQAQQSAQYFRAVCSLDGHSFTVDVVTDPTLFEVGGFHSLDSGVKVAALETLLMSKAATLVSRCSEKDLYDLLWILDGCEISLEQLLELGARLDRGLNAEAVLISLTSAPLSAQACHFGLTAEQQAETIFGQVSALRDELVEEVSRLLHGQPSPPLGKTVAKLKRWRRS